MRRPLWIDPGLDREGRSEPLERGRVGHVDIVVNAVEEKSASGLPDAEPQMSVRDIVAAPSGVAHVAISAPEMYETGGRREAARQRRHRRGRSAHDHARQQRGVSCRARVHERVQRVVPRRKPVWVPVVVPARSRRALVGQATGDVRPRIAIRGCADRRRRIERGQRAGRGPGPYEQINGIDSARCPRTRVERPAGERDRLVSDDVALFGQIDTAGGIARTGRNGHDPFDRRAALIPCRVHDCDQRVRPARQAAWVPAEVPARRLKASCAERADDVAADIAKRRRPQRVPGSGAAVEVKRDRIDADALRCARVERPSTHIHGFRARRDLRAAGGLVDVSRERRRVRFHACGRRRRSGRRDGLGRNRDRSWCRFGHRRGARDGAAQREDDQNSSAAHGSDSTPALFRFRLTYELPSTTHPATSRKESAVPSQQYVAGLFAKSRTSPVSTETRFV